MTSRAEAQARLAKNMLRHVNRFSRVVVETDFRKIEGHLCHCVSLEKVYKASFWMGITQQQAPYLFNQPVLNDLAILSNSQLFSELVFKVVIKTTQGIPNLAQCILKASQKHAKACSRLGWINFSKILLHHL